jgi:hypothetical protein
MLSEEVALASIDQDKLTEMSVERLAFGSNYRRGASPKARF